MCKNSLFIPQSVKSKHSFLLYFEIAKELSEFRNYLITCGIYGLYWLYKMGERCDRIKGMNGNSGILYLILGIVGFSIISYCLMQDTLNKAV